MRKTRNTSKVKKDDRNITNGISNGSNGGDKDLHAKGKGRTKSTRHVSGPNDTAWYNLEPRITKDAATIPFGLPMGHSVHLESSWNHLDNDLTVPGIVALHVTHTLGTIGLPTDPINRAASQIYAFTVHANSRNVNYDEADIMMYLLGMSEIYALTAHCKRIYGLSRLFTFHNRYIPETVFKAIDVSPSLLRGQMSDYRLRLNSLISKISTFAVPFTMPIFARREWMYSGLYSDSEDVRDQLYLFVPNGFHTLDWEQASLTWHHLSDLPGWYGSSRASTDPMGLLDVLEGMINDMYNTTDMGIMNGDIQKAYGDAVHKIEYIDEGYAVVPSVQPTVLEQIMNCTPVGDLDTRTLDIVSDYTDGTESAAGLSVLKSNPKLLQVNIDNTEANTLASVLWDAAQRAALVAKPMLFSHMLNPVPEYIVDISRLTVAVAPGNSEEDLHLICGTEVVTDIYVSPKPDVSWKQRFVHVNSNFLFDSLEDDTEAMRDMVTQLVTGTQFEMYTKAFKYLPKTVMMRFDEVKRQAQALLAGKCVSDSSGPLLITYPTTNFTVLDYEDLNNIHTAAVQNLFYVPKVGISLSK